MPPLSHATTDKNVCPTKQRKPRERRFGRSLALPLEDRNALARRDYYGIVGACTGFTRKITITGVGDETNGSRV